MTPEIWAVVVLYRPEPALLAQQFAALGPQVRGVLYYDNGGGQEALAGLGLLGAPGVRCLGGDGNRGLASALNAGLRAAIEAGADFALLLDQDSAPASEMVARLHQAYLAGGGPGANVAAVGPALFDTLLGRVVPFGQALRLSRRLVPRAPDHHPFEVSYLITSGTLLATPVLASVGLMEAGLFIDSIDYEWCARARARGHRLLASYGASLRHRRGEGLHHAWPGLRIRLHPASRLLSIYQNQVRLLFRGYMPVRWRLRAIVDLAVRMWLLALFVPGRARHLGAMLRGIGRGLRLGWAERALTPSSAPARWWRCP